MYPSLTPSIALRVLDTLLALLIASILGTVLLGASAVFASDDSAFYFDESSKMQMNDTWSAMSPNSRRTTDEDRRQYNDYVNSQTLKQNEALIQSYDRPQAGYDRPPAPLTPPGGGQSDYWVTSPAGKSQWCRSISKRIVGLRLVRY